MRDDRQGKTKWVAPAIWICFIWLHSLIPGDTSSSESGFFLSLAYPLFEGLGIHDASLMHFVIRKGAHFLEYFILGVLSLRALRTQARNKLSRVALLCCLWVGVPAIDEIIQLFTPDRQGALRDVLIDMSGFAVGALLTAAILTWARRHKDAAGKR